MSAEEKPMEYELKDPKTGEIKRYEISYSQTLQKESNELNKKIINELEKSNKLKKWLLLGLCLTIIGTILIFTNTGTIGEVIRLGFCQ